MQPPKEESIKLGKRRKRRLEMRLHTLDLPPTPPVKVFFCMRCLKRYKAYHNTCRRCGCVNTAYVMEFIPFLIAVAVLIAGAIWVVKSGHLGSFH